MNDLPYKIIGYGLILLFVFYAGWKVKGWKDDSDYKEGYAVLMNQINEEQQKNAALSQNYVHALHQYNQTTQELTHHVKIEVEKQPVYRDCVLPDGGVQLINTAVDQANQLKSSR